MGGVNLRDGMRPAQLLFEVLSTARERHAGVFGDLSWPGDAKAFRADYASRLVAFERARIASPERVEIARTIVDATTAAMVFAGDAGETPLPEHMRGASEPLPTETLKLDHGAGLVPEVSFRGVHYEGEKVGELVDAWRAAHWMTPSAHAAVRWTLGQALAGEGGRAHFVGQKCVSLGGGAELSPTRAMLRAGADVLYIDARDPSDELLKDPRVSGTLTYVPGGADLLAQPREIATTIARFAGDDPVHVGMYAYAGGAGKEWRLTAAMNAVVRALPPALVRSVVMLISPTTPGAVDPDDAATADARRGRMLLRPLAMGGGEAALGQSGVLPARVSHSILLTQGVSYQAAQYIGKMMAAEVYAGYGVSGDGGGELVVSAPVAPITTTRSLQHPLFEAAFAGADAFDVLISEPQATRVMCALLAFHDLLNPGAPSARRDLPPAERVAAILGQQIHGGVYAQPHQLEREISLAALLGFTRRPGLFVPAVRFMMGK